MLSGQIIPDTVSDAAYPKIALSNAKQLYSKTIGKEAHLYNGREYNQRFIGVEGNPFYNENIWNNGSVYYDHQLYNSVHLKLDIYNNLIIIGFYDTKGFFSSIQLVTEKIKYFNWSGHFFINIENNTLENPGLSSSFYDLLYDGKIKVLGQYTKSIQKNLSSTPQLDAFFEKNIFYVVKGKQLFKIKKKRSILKALADKEREIKAYIKKHKLKFKDENLRGIQIARVAAYYDSINE